MNTWDTLWNAVQTYFAVAFALFLAHSSAITAVGAFVLLLLRLTYELPKAVRAIRDMTHKEKHD